MGKRIGQGLWSISLPVLSRSVEMGSHYRLTAVQWPVWNEEVVSVQFPCGQVSLTSKPPPALAVPGSSACTPWTGDGASTVQWLQRNLHAEQDADGFECFWYQQLCSFLQIWLVLWLSCFGDLLKTSPGFSAPVWTQHSHWFPRSRAFRSAQISAVADGSSIPARMAWWSSRAEHWHPMTPARAIWRAGQGLVMGCLVPAPSGTRKPLLLTQPCRCFCCSPGGGMVSFLEKSGFLLTGWIVSTWCPQMFDGLCLTQSASHIEHGQERGERLAMRARGICLGLMDKGGGRSEILIML